MVRASLGQLSVWQARVVGRRCALLRNLVFGIAARELSGLMSKIELRDDEERLVAQVSAPMKSAARPRRRPKIIGMVGKGGGGKTSTAISLSLAAERAGLRVAIIGLDPQKCIHAWWTIRNRNDVPVASMTTTEAIGFIKSGKAEQLDLLIVDCGKDPSAGLGDLVELFDMALLPMRPSFLDINVTRNWVDWLSRHDTPHVVLINAAPPRRRLPGQRTNTIPPRVQESPLVRDTREALRLAKFRVWKGQLSYLHGMMSAIGRGRGFIEVMPEGPAALEIQWLLHDLGEELGICRRQHNA